MGTVRVVQEPLLQHMASDEIKRRNETEKKRRDRFNSLIDELAGFICDRCKTKRSKHKCSILKITKEYFLEQEELAGQKTSQDPFGWEKPDFLADDELCFVLQESSRAFVFAVDRESKIVYSSDSALNAVGYLPCQILQRSIYDFIHLQYHFIFQGLLSNFLISSVGDTKVSQRFEPFLCYFCRGPYAQEKGFEAVICHGTIFKNLQPDEGQTLEDSHYILVLAKPLNRVSTNTTLVCSDGPQTKFTARICVVGKYEYLDKRVVSVLGFFPSELIGNSFFDYCHPEDLENLAEYCEILLMTGRLATCYYRQLTKAQSWIWLRSLFDLSYSDWSSKPQAITCLSWVVHHEEVCARHEDILASDRVRFEQIRAAHQNANCKLISSPSSNQSPESAWPGVTSGRTIGSEREISKVNRVTSTIVSDVQSDNNINKLTTNEMVDFQGFLARLQFPEKLTTAQENAHLLLTGMYKDLLNTIKKQNEELESIQKQLKVEGELRDLLETLEEVKARNDMKEEYAVTSKIMEKFEEIRNECTGTRAEKPLAGSYELCRKRLEEIRGDKRVRKRQDATVNDVQTAELFSDLFGQQNIYSLLHKDQQQSQLRVHDEDIFFDQAKSLQNQGQQFQMQEQVLTEQLHSAQNLPQQRQRDRNGNILPQAEQELVLEIPNNQQQTEHRIESWDFPPAQSSTIFPFDLSLLSVPNSAAFPMYPPEEH